MCLQLDSAEIQLIIIYVTVLQLKLDYIANFFVKSCIRSNKEIKTEKKIGCTLF